MLMVLLVKINVNGFLGVGNLGELDWDSPVCRQLSRRAAGLMDKSAPVEYRPACVFVNEAEVSDEIPGVSEKRCTLTIAYGSAK